MSQAVLTHSPCPVIIAKSDGYSELQDVQAGFKSVLITVDDSAYSEAALRWLSNFQWSHDTRFTIATVVDDLPATFSQSAPARAANILHEHDTLISAARFTLHARAQQLAGTLGSDNVFIEIGVGDAKQAILQMAQTRSVDLIVMGSHGRSGFTKLLIGSVSQAVSKQADCAVAIIRGVVPKADGTMKKTGVFKIPANMVAPSLPAIKREEGEMPHVVPYGGGMG